MTYVKIKDLENRQDVYNLLKAIQHVDFWFEEHKSNETLEKNRYVIRSLSSNYNWITIIVHYGPESVVAGNVAEFKDLMYFRYDCESSKLYTDEEWEAIFDEED